MTITKLSIANGAMRLLKERLLTQAELTGNLREPARIFNSIWDDGAIDACLEAGQWKFAKRTVMLDASPSIEPDFGYRYGFGKPDDFIRAAGQWLDENLTTPLASIREEAGYWFSNVETFYLSYVSNDELFGGDYSLWPQSFLKFVQAHIASEIAGPLTSEGGELLKLRSRLLRDALSTDAMADPTKFAPAGSWVRARRSGWRRSGEQ